jgi:hypothetical protein
MSGSTAQHQMTQMQLARTSCHSPKRVVALPRTGSPDAPRKYTVAPSAPEPPRRNLTCQSSRPAWLSEMPTTPGGTSRPVATPIQSSSSPSGPPAKHFCRSRKQRASVANAQFRLSASISRSRQTKTQESGVALQKTSDVRFVASGRPERVLNASLQLPLLQAEHLSPFFRFVDVWLNRREAERIARLPFRDIPASM